MKRLLLFLLILSAPLAAQSTTTIQDTLLNADGTPLVATIRISWPEFVQAGSTVIAGDKTIQVTNGAFSVPLVSNVSAGVVYTVHTTVGRVVAATCWS